MKKKIYLAGLAAGILLAMLPAGTVKASEKQTTEEYYYQLLLSGAYPYNTAANAGGLNTAPDCRPEAGSRLWPWQISS